MYSEIVLNLLQDKIVLPETLKSAIVGNSSLLELAQQFEKFINSGDEDSAYGLCLLTNIALQGGAEPVYLILKDLIEAPRILSKDEKKRDMCWPYLQQMLKVYHKDFEPLVVTAIHKLCIQGEYHAFLS